MLIAWTLPTYIVPMDGWSLSILTISGGVLFGVGATVNGGCAFSTLTRLGAGNVGMIASLLGFLGGAATFGAIAANGLTSSLGEGTAYLSRDGTWRVLATVALILWMIWELVRLVRTARPGGWQQRFLASSYRLSSAAVLMGISSAVLYAMIGVWPYTRLLGEVAENVATGSRPPPAVLWILFLALIAGIGLSAWHSRRFRWQWRPRRDWTGFVVGGFLMGCGAAMIPGGNDVLILHGIPSLSAHAVPAFLAMLVGIAASLVGMHAVGWDIPRIDCKGDICTPELS